MIREDRIVTSTLLAAVTACAVACGAGQTADTLVESDDPELRRLAGELLPDLAERSGLELRAPVRVARRSRTDLIRYLKVKLDRELPPAEAAAISESYRLLGLMPAGLDLREILLEVYGEQVAGFYDPDSTAIFVIDDQPAEALRTVLIHELVHAVQDQASDLDSLTSRRRGNDRQMAAQAAIEGHATLVMLEYLTEQLQGQPVDLAEIPDFATQVRPALAALRSQYPALTNAPRVVRESLLFPYLEGAAFVQRLWHEQGGRPSPLGEQLPQSTEQVLVAGPVLPSARDEPTEIRLQAEGLRYSNTLGAMETGILLEELTGGDGAASLGWDGDRFALVGTAGEPALAWLTVWDDAAARDRFVTTLAPALDRLPLPATLVARDIEGRPAALLEVGAPGAVTATLTGDGG